MIWIWFGLDGTGITRSSEFHWFLGPAVMILFAFLGNTLFLTILVSMLSNTFSVIVANAVQEIQFRRAVLTFEGVKSDAIFAYMPPFNMLALLIMLPLKMVLSPRAFHKVNVAAVRTLNLPALLIIGLYERHSLWVVDKRKHGRPARIDWKNANGPRIMSTGWWQKTMTFWNFSRFSVRGDIQAVFEVEPPEDLLKPIPDGEDAQHADGLTRVLDEQFQGAEGMPTVNGKRPPSASERKSRRTSRASKSLKKEFADSSEEDRAKKDTDAPTGYHSIKRTQRMDSLVDFSSDGSMNEANARLQRLEESVEKLQGLLVQFMSGGNGDDDNERGQEVLEQQLQTGTLN